MFGRKQNEIETIIGGGSSVRGRIVTSGTVRIDGEVVGDVEADWVIIGEAGSINGDVGARGAVIGGTVRGDIKVKESVEILDKGRLYGDVYSARLAVMEGAIFCGHSFMQDGKAGGSRVVMPLFGQGGEQH
jgi:cytoskeletal protein CcmA (bactofilin family)